MSEQSGLVLSAAIVPGPARRGGTRWGVGLLAMAIVVGALGAIGTLVSTPTPPEAIGFVPAGSAAVLELRPDLPGDQRQALGTMLGRLPGFGDLGSLNDRVGAALDKVVAKASDGKHTYTGDLRPYAAGAAILVVPSAPTAAAGAAVAERGLAILTTEGSPGCAPLEDGRAATVERYGGSDLRTTQVSRPDRTGAQTTMAVACAVSGRFVLVGDPGSVRASLDARAQGRSVMGDSAYTAAFRAMTGDHAAWAYINTRAAEAVAAAAPVPSGMTRPVPAADPPAWMALQLRFTDRGPVIETAMPDTRGSVLAGASAAPGGTPAPNAISQIAPALPATTVALIEGHQVGALLSAIQAARPAAGSTGGPAASAQATLRQSLAILGGSQAILGGLDQAVVAVVPNGSDVTAGLVLQVENAEAAAARIDQLRGLAGLAGLLGGTPVTEQDYHGTEITSIPLGGILALAGSGSTPGSGSFPGLGGLPGAVASLRPTTSAAPGASGAPKAGVPALPADARLSVAVHGSLVLVALDDAFLKAVIDTPAGGGLADQAAYQAAVSAAGGPNLGSLYLNVAALEGLAPRNLSADQASRMASARPYLEAVGAVAGSLTSSDGLLRGRFVVTLP